MQYAKVIASPSILYRKMMLHCTAKIILKDTEDSVIGDRKRSSPSSHDAQQRSSHNKLRQKMKGKLATQAQPNVPWNGVHDRNHTRHPHCITKVSDNKSDFKLTQSHRQSCHSIAHIWSPICLQLHRFWDIIAENLKTSRDRDNAHSRDSL